MMGLADTRPAENTNDPTPKSIKDVPHVSTFPKRRGKTGKSTANIARHVMMIMPPLYAVRNGRTGRGFGSSFSFPFCTGYLMGGAGFEGNPHMNVAMPASHT